MFKNISRWFLSTFITFTCLSECIQSVQGDISCPDQFYTENEDDIKSPRIPSDSNDIVDCVYDIKLAEKSRWLRLSWQSFDLVGTMPKCNEAEYVEVYSGYIDHICRKITGKYHK